MAFINIESDDPKFVKEVRKASITATFLMAALGTMSAGNYWLTRHLADDVTQKDGLTCSHFIDKEKNTKTAVCSSTFGEYAIPTIATLGLIGFGGLTRSSSRRLRELKQENNNGNPPPPPTGPDK